MKVGGEIDRYRSNEVVTSYLSWVEIMGHFLLRPTGNTRRFRPAKFFYMYNTKPTAAAPGMHLLHAPS